MKHLSLILSLFVVVNARDPTIVDELLAGQSELSLGHEFMERLLHDNRMMLSSYLLDLENAAINSFMDSYTVVANIADATTKAMDEFESSFCKDRIRARWNLQVTRYGNRLSECLAVTTRQMQDWNVQLNNYHETGQVTSNQVQNQGMFAITELNEFDRMHPFQELFNRRFRLILARAVPYMLSFDALVERVHRDLDVYIHDLTDCDRNLTVAFRQEAIDDLERINRCYSD